VREVEPHLHERVRDGRLDAADDGRHAHEARAKRQIAYTACDVAVEDLDAV
jgi:hypothetical protein